MHNTLCRELVASTKVITKDLFEITIIAQVLN